jgi:hypothetical protein
LSLIESSPVRDPVCVGLNVTAMLHRPPAAIEEQLFVWLKSPVALTPETVKGAEPELVKTTLFVLLEVLSNWLPNEIGVVERLRTGVACSPVPDREKVRGLFSALELTVKVPFLTPVALGVKTMLRVHVSWSARDDKHVLSDAISKSPDPTVMLGMILLIPDELAL